MQGNFNDGWLYNPKCYPNNIMLITFWHTVLICYPLSRAHNQMKNSIQCVCRKCYINLLSFLSFIGCKVLLYIVCIIIVVTLGFECQSGYICYITFTFIYYHLHTYTNIYTQTHTYTDDTPPPTLGLFRGQLKGHCTIFNSQSHLGL